MQGLHARRAEVVLETAVFDEPFEALSREHQRQRWLCDLLVRLAHNPRHGAEAGDIEAACDYLARDLSLHIADEQDTLVPLLRLRATEQDNIAAVAAILIDGHDADELVAMAILVDLERLASGRGLRDPLGFFGQAVKLASGWRRHLDWEDRVFLPLAKRRLERADLVHLGREMAKRRAAPAAA
jgi:hemerythrin-like domain-containing protein